ncbi:MAG: TAXI family TRAP transporter solute-binding subunit [Desulfobacteraceae bacterium]|jgi:TRAP transporter TAXI family solute receptor|nr:TAXI family TRAP transporter solute-binding subunit [Desulfobacteraceae bacterium]
MKKSFPLIMAITIALILTLSVTGPVYAKKLTILAGGPAGGTFQVVAQAIATYGPVKAMEDYNIKVQSSGGSPENLRRVNSGKAQFGTVYSLDVYAGRNGLLVNDPVKYDKVMAVNYLYDAPAQLVVRKDSGINSAMDLVGKKVGVGNAGSGAYSFCEMFFTHLGIWDKIERNAMGYNAAADAFGNNQLDAFWLFTAYPAPAVIQAATMNDIALVNLDADAKKYGFYEKFKNLAPMEINTSDERYRGISENVPSFSDAAIWVANADVSEDFVYNLLKAIYTPDGLAWMVTQKKTFKAMTVEKGVLGIATPLHPGAEKFWKEMGVLK